MFSLADASGHRTALVALRNCLYLLPLGYLAYDCKFIHINVKILRSIFTLYFLASLHPLFLCSFFPEICISIMLSSQFIEHLSIYVVLSDNTF